MKTPQMNKGKVYIVGAGPGDPGLLTLNGLDSLQSADVILYDRLVDQSVLDFVSSNAEIIYVGKLPGYCHNPQTEINNLLVSKAKQGKIVVRLKGGDPFVYGRGSEEASILNSEDIPFEIIPGVSSVTGVPAYAGIPLTHRGISSSFTVISGHESSSNPESNIDWESLAKNNGTLVILMGADNINEITDKLILNGKPAETPVALISHGTKNTQRTISSTIDNINKFSKECSIESPMIMIVGNVVSLRKTLQWFDNRPLFGKRILITRPHGQSTKLSQLLSERGAIPIVIPTIAIEQLSDYDKLDNSLKNLHYYDWIIFTSSNAIDIFFERLRAIGLDSRALNGVSVATIGPSTSNSLQRHGISVDFSPQTFTSAGIVNELSSGIHPGDEVLLPQSDISGDLLNDGLRDMGVSVDNITVYKTRTEVGSKTKIHEILNSGADVVTFTSASSVKNISDLLNDNINQLSDMIVACIGPTTAAAAAKIGLEVDIIGEEFTINGLTDALEAHFDSKDM